MHTSRDIQKSKSGDILNTASGNPSINSEAEAVIKIKQHVSENVIAAGITGAAAEVLIGQAPTLLEKSSTFAALLDITKETLIEKQAQNLTGTTLQDLVRQFTQAETMQQVKNGMKEVALKIESPSLQTSFELLMCLSNATTSSGVQGLFSNFGPIFKFHDIEAQSAAVIRTCAANSKISPYVKDGQAGVMIEVDGKSGFFPFKVYLEQVDGLLFLKDYPRSSELGSLNSCQHRGFLLAVLSYAANVPELLNSRHKDGNLQPCGDTWTLDATKQVTDIFNKLEDAYRPVYGNGIHTSIMNCTN